MVNKRASSHTLEDTGGSSDVDTLVGIHAAKDELHLHNQTLKEIVHNIRRHQ